MRLRQFAEARGDGCPAVASPLLLTFDPGAVMQPPVVSWCRQHLAALDICHIGAGIHFVHEDQGAAIGVAIAEWRSTLGPA